MRKTMLLACAALVMSTATMSSQSISSDRLARIDRLFQQYVDEERIGNTVALVLQDDKPVYERAFGWSDKEAGLPSCSTSATAPPMRSSSTYC